MAPKRLANPSAETTARHYKELELVEKAFVMNSPSRPLGEATPAFKQIF